MRTTPFAAIHRLFVTTDEQAMWCVQTRADEGAFAQLVRRWEIPIQRLCTRVTGDPHRGEDLAQEAFARVFARRMDWQPDGKFSTWLWRIALNLCYDELRRIKRRSEASLEAGGEESDDATEGMVALEPTPDASLVEQERSELVRQALLRLPETYRIVLVMRHYEDLKFREIAEVLEIPEGTVKSRMAEALAQLGRQLRPVLETAAAQPGTRNPLNRESERNAENGAALGEPKELRGPNSITQANIPETSFCTISGNLRPTL